MKLIPKKAGNGYTSSYTLNISLNAARRCGFVDESGERFELEAIEKPDEKAIIIRVVRAEGE